MVAGGFACGGWLFRCTELTAGAAASPSLVACEVWGCRSDGRGYVLVLKNGSEIRFKSD